MFFLGHPPKKRPFKLSWKSTVRVVGPNILFLLCDKITRAFFMDSMDFVYLFIKMSKTNHYVPKIWGANWKVMCYAPRLMIRVDLLLLYILVCHDENSDGWVILQSLRVRSVRTISSHLGEVLRSIPPQVVAILTSLNCSFGLTKTYARCFSRRVRTWFPDRWRSLKT